MSLIPINDLALPVSHFHSYAPHDTITRNSNP